MGNSREKARDHSYHSTSQRAPKRNVQSNLEQSTFAVNTPARYVLQEATSSYPARYAQPSKCLHHQAPVAIRSQDTHSMQAPTSVACTRYPTNPKQYVESVASALSTTSSDVCQRWYKREIDFETKSISSDFCSQVSLPPSLQPDGRSQVTQSKVDKAAIRRWISEVDSDLSAPSVKSTKRRDAPISGARHVQPTPVPVPSRVGRRRRNSKGLFETEKDEAQRWKPQRRTLVPRAIRQEKIARGGRSYRG